MDTHTNLQTRVQKVENALPLTKGITNFFRISRNGDRDVMDASSPYRQFFFVYEPGELSCYKKTVRVQNSPFE